MMSEKEAYQEKADAQLREWQAWIERFKSDLVINRKGKQHNPQRLLRRLEDSYRAARGKLEVLYSSRGEQWERAKEDLERAMIDLKQALDESGAGKMGGQLQLRSARSRIYEPFER